MKYTIAFCLASLLFLRNGFAGPPFDTDDPVPVPYKHWEYYISSINTFEPDVWTGTSPHFEVNYGMIRNMQIHLLVPLNYMHVRDQGTRFGYGDTELGVKYCFLKETQKRPQVGTFPIFEVPTVNNEDFTNGRLKVFLPVWVQKSWNKLTTYGGAGCWINPGPGNRNSAFLGWELQYDFSEAATLGGELHFQSADAADSKSTLAFNLGGQMNISSKMHFIFSVGHSLSGENYYSSYVGLLWTI